MHHPRPPRPSAVASRSPRRPSLLACAAPASAAERVTTIKGASGPGPSRYDKVFVTKFGSSKAKKVLVLVPGTSGGAGDFTLMARAW